MVFATEKEPILMQPLVLRKSKILIKVNGRTISSTESVNKNTQRTLLQEWRTNTTATGIKAIDMVREL